MLPAKTARAAFFLGARGLEKEAEQDFVCALRGGSLRALAGYKLLSAPSAKPPRPLRFRTFFYLISFKRKSETARNHRENLEAEAFALRLSGRFSGRFFATFAISLLSSPRFDIFFYVGGYPLFFEFVTENLQARDNSLTSATSLSSYPLL